MPVSVMLHLSRGNRRLSEVSGCGGVAQSGARAEPEDSRQVQGVSPARQGLFYDPVVAELLGGDRQVAEQPVHPEAADRFASMGGLAGDEQVGAGSGGPPGVAEVEVVADCGGGELVKRPVQATGVEPAA